MSRLQHGGQDTNNWVAIVASCIHNDSFTIALRMVLHSVLGTNDKQVHASSLISSSSTKHTTHSSVLQHRHNTRPRLHHSWLDLVRRKREPIRSSIPKLVCVRVRSVTSDVRIISRGPSRSIQSRTARPNGVYGSRHRADRSLSARRE
jgi:hypothetical protein